jgi:hypothetical protein
LKKKKKLPVAIFSEKVVIKNLCRKVASVSKTSKPIVENKGLNKDFKNL